MKVMSKKNYSELHKDSKGIVDGKKYAVYLDKKTGATVYGPVRVRVK